MPYANQNDVTNGLGAAAIPGSGFGAGLTAIQNGMTAIGNIPQAQMRNAVAQNYLDQGDIRDQQNANALTTEQQKAQDLQDEQGARDLYPKIVSMAQEVKDVTSKQWAPNTDLSPYLQSFGTFYNTQHPDGFLVTNFNAGPNGTVVATLQNTKDGSMSSFTQTPQQLKDYVKGAIPPTYHGYMTDLAAQQKQDDALALENARGANQLAAGAQTQAGAMSRTQLEQEGATGRQQEKLAADNLPPDPDDPKSLNAQLTVLNQMRSDVNSQNVATGHAAALALKELDPGINVDFTDPASVTAAMAAGMSRGGVVQKARADVAAGKATDAQKAALASFDAAQSAYTKSTTRYQKIASMRDGIAKKLGVDVDAPDTGAPQASATPGAPAAVAPTVAAPQAPAAPTAPVAYSAQNPPTGTTFAGTDKASGRPVFKNAQGALVMAQ